MYYKLKGIYKFMSIVFILSAVGAIASCFFGHTLLNKYGKLYDILFVSSLFGLLFSITYTCHFEYLENKIIYRKKRYKENLNKRKKLWKLKCDIEEANKYLDLHNFRVNQRKDSLEFLENCIKEVEKW